MENNTIFIILIVLMGLYLFKKSKGKCNTKISNKGNIHNHKNNFPYPQSTSESINLSKHDVQIIHPKMMVSEPIEYKKGYLKHDILSPNPQGSTEYQHVASEPGKSWTEENVSQHPEHYRKDFTDEITDTGSFFNKQNNLVDNTSPKSKTYLPDRCFVNTNNEILCDFNNKLQNIPPKTFESNNTLIQSIGQENNYNPKSVSSNDILNVNNNNYQTWNFKNENIMNGGDFFNGIQGSSQLNETNLSIDKLPKVNYSL
jgi:hypothetical protein